MLTARSLQEACLLWLRDPNQDWHTDPRMLIFMNRALKDLAEWSHTITSYAFYPVTEGIFRIALPDNFLHLLIAGYTSKTYD